MNTKIPGRKNHFYSVLLFSLIWMIIACRIPTFSSSTAQEKPAAEPQLAVLASHVPSSSTRAAEILPTVLPIPSVRNATVNIYEIYGSSAQELRQQMNQRGPVDPQDGSHVDAYTQWTITWNWRGYGTADCDLSTAKVDVFIEVTLPYWQPAADAPAPLIRQWNTYLQALVAHEQQHVSHAAEQQARMLEAIRAASCTTAEQAAQEIVREMNAFDAQYDQETRHGASEGVVFP